MAESTTTPKLDTKTHKHSSPQNEVTEAALQNSALDVNVLQRGVAQSTSQHTKQMLQMQRVLGNQSVLRLMKTQQLHRHVDIWNASAEEPHSPGTCKCGGRCAKCKAAAAQHHDHHHSEEDNAIQPSRADTAKPHVHAHEHTPSSNHKRQVKQPHGNSRTGDNTQTNGDDFSLTEITTVSTPQAELQPLSSDSNDDAAPTVVHRATPPAIQRISLDDLDPTAIIDQVRGFLSAGEGAEENAEAATETQAEHTKQQSEQSADTLEAQTEQTVEQSAQMEEQAHTQQTQVETQAQDGESQVAQAGNQGTNQVQNTVSAVMPALSIANQIANPTAGVAAATAVGGLGQPLAASPETMGAISGQIGASVSSGLAADGQAGWNCDQAEILAIASNLGKAALEPFIRAADNLTGGGASALIEFAGQIGSKVRKTAEEVMAAVRQLGSAIGNRIEELTRPLVNVVREGMQAVSEAYNQAKQFVTDTWNNAKTAFVDGWNTLKNAASQWVTNQIASARQTIQNAINQASSIISSAGSTIRDLLPDWVTDGIDDLRSTISDVQDTIHEGIDDAVEFAEEVKDDAINTAKDLADGALQSVTEGYRAAQEAKDAVVEGIQDAGRAAVEMIPQPVRDAASAASDFVGEQVDNVRSAAGEVMQEVSGVVCKPISDIAAPCLDRYLPFNESTSSSVALTSAQSVTVPLHEIGIPANAQIGEGSSMTLSRTGPNTYTLRVAGDSSIMFTEKAAGTNLSVGVDLPTGQNVKGEQVWRQLTSGGAPAAQPAAGQPNGAQAQNGASGSGGAGGAGGGSNVEAKAGIKQTVSVTYTFNTNGTCDLASLAGVLAGYGVTGALASIAPSPFSDIISAGGGAATAGAFNGYITNISMTNAVAGEAKMGLGSGDAGSIDGSVSGSVSQTHSLDRDSATGELVPSTTYGVEIGGALAGKLKLGDFMTVGGSLGAKGSLSLKLGYQSGDIVPQEFIAAAEASLALNGFSVAQLPIDYIPGDAPAVIQQRLDMLRNLGVNGSVKAAFKYKVSNLANIYNALRAFFDSAPIESITWGGVMDIVAEEFAKNPPTTSFTVTLTETERVGVSVSGGVAAEGANIGVSASVSASRNIVHQLYPPAGATPTPTPTPVPDQPVTPPVPGPHPEPEHPTPIPEQPPPQPGGGGATPPAHKNPLDMTVEEFEASPEGQRELFAMANEARLRQEAFAHAILAETQSPGNATSILKRDNFDDFVKGVIEKCRRKGYARIGMMDDIVRGRFNLDLGPDVERVAIALQNQTEFPVTVVERPRRPNEHGFGYPRWHVVVRDSSGITHEWQVGTQAVTDVYETRGIEIPSEVGNLPDGMHNDIHDIEYDILRRIQQDHPEIAAEAGIPDFRKQVDLISAQAGSQGKNMPDLQERIGELHTQCSAILRLLVDRHGPDIIRKYFKH